MCLFPKRYNADAQVDIKEARGKDIIKRKYLYCVAFIYENDNNNKNTNTCFCEVITPQRLFMWVLRFRAFIHVGVLKTVINITDRIVFGTMSWAINKRKQAMCKT